MKKFSILFFLSGILFSSAVSTKEIFSKPRITDQKSKAPVYKIVDFSLNIPSVK